MNFTIFGEEGFIGRNLVRHLQAQGHTVLQPGRSGEKVAGKELGHVIYAIGLTADFRTRPFDTVEAHVCKLAKLLTDTRFASWLYLSSTRVYGGLSPDDIASESKPLPVFPDLDGIYNISKLMGESLCLTHPNEKVRVVRLSNVCGYGQEHNFLASLVKELMHSGKAVIQEAPESAKDYITLSDVLLLLEKIALLGRERIYNLASGKLVTHNELAEQLTALTGGAIQFAENAPRRRFPLIDTSRIKNEFGFIATGLYDFLPELLVVNNPSQISGGVYFE